MAEFNMDQFEQDYRNERRKALRNSYESGETSFPALVLQHGANRIGERVSDTVQGIGAFAKSLYNNPQAVAESGAKGLEALYNRVAQEDPMAAMEVAGMVATGGATAAVAKGARLADFATFDPNTSRMFIGAIGAKNLADAGKPVAEKVLKVARQMRMMGASEAEIRAKTNRIIENEDPSLGGVSLNANGQLVVEIDDSKMAVRSDSAIARATGGYQTPAGGMYFSTDINNVLKGTPLGKAYPNEINMKVSDVSEAPRENVLGSFDENTNTITSFALKTDVPGVTAHELQHFIQAREGFPRGGNEIDALDGMYGNMANDYDEISTLLRQFNGKPVPKEVYQQFENPEIMRASLSKIRRDHEGDDDAAADFAEDQAVTIRDDPEGWAKTIYSYLAGEVEARNVQTRLKMTPAERRATPPSETETDARFKMPLLREDQIISKRAQGGEVMQGIGTLNETARNMFRGPSGVGAYQQFASGGEAMGPPPTRGPDPQGIGAFQKFADGGPVYMQEGGTGKDALATNHFDLIKEKYPSVDPLKISQEEGLPPQLISVFQRLLFQENQSADASAVGTSGEIGLAQLMPVTAKDVGVNRDNLIDNVRGGARYLFKMYNRFDQDPMKAVAAYNAGPTAIVDNLDRNDGQLNIGQLPSTTQSYLGFVVQPVLNQTEVAQTIDPMMAGEDLAMSMPVAQSDYLSPEAQENIRQGTQFQGGSPTGDLSIGEQIRREKFKPNVSFEGQEMEAMPVNLRDKYSSKNMQEQLVGGQEPLDKGIAGLTRSLRPPLRPEEGLTRSLRPPFRPEEEEMREPQDRYPGTNTDIGEGFGIYI